MYISTNKLKEYIKNGESIDWNKAWEDFTLRSAEIDGIENKGENIKGVVVAEVLELKKHDSNKNYTIALLDIGNKKEIKVVTSAKNLVVGMKVPCALEGGSLKEMEKITSVKLEGVLSQGVLASEKEIGISDNHLEIMVLDKSLINGTNIKKHIPIDDMIIEIDNKSLTNRPDMWGHYGIAREICAITGFELLEIDIAENIDGKEKLKVDVIDKESCNRYSCLKIGNITQKQANLKIKTMLYYCGMRSISLIVDLTNYLMLELGQPMHAFDSKQINNIVVKSTYKKIVFKTLDGIERNINKNTLMIYNDEKPVAIAGIIGGTESEIDEKTNSLILESANFDAFSIRKSALGLGLRTEASVRYEKSLDPNMTVIAIKRFVKLLKETDSNITVDSKIEDVYINKVLEKNIELKKDYLKKYMGFKLEDKKVVEILTSLKFKVEVKSDKYIITSPTYRSTKEISNPADIIEEIARIYGYNKLEETPLKLDLVVKSGDNKYELEYELKKSLAINTGYSEIHTYLWYDSALLNKYNINKNENTLLVNKKDNNILRDDLSLSLFEKCLENSKYYNEYGIFELGSVVENEKEERILSILSVCNRSDISNTYQQLKQTLYKIIKDIKNIDIDFEKGNVDKKYLNNEYTLIIKTNKKEIGYISIFENNFSKDCGKKSSIINAELNIEKILNLKSEAVLYTEPSKYPTTNIDYTIILEKETPYAQIEKVLEKYSNKYLIKYYLKEIYLDEKKKVTFRFIIGSNNKTLVNEQIKIVQEDIQKTIESNGYNIVK